MKEEQNIHSPLKGVEAGRLSATEKEALRILLDYVARWNKRDKSRVVDRAVVLLEKMLLDE